MLLQFGKRGTCRHIFLPGSDLRTVSALFYRAEAKCVAPLWGRAVSEDLAPE
jgi:hypothetical protein